MAEKTWPVRCHGMGAPTRTCVAAGTRCPTPTAAPWSPRRQLSSLCKHLYTQAAHARLTDWRCCCLLVGRCQQGHLPDGHGYIARGLEPSIAQRLNNYFCFLCFIIVYARQHLPGLALVARPTVATAVYRVVASRFASHSVLECFNTRIVIEDSSRVMRNGSQQATRGQCALAADA